MERNSSKDQQHLQAITINKIGFSLVHRHAKEVHTQSRTLKLNDTNITFIKQCLILILKEMSLSINNADYAMFTEVLEHIHYYYVPLVLSKINRALKLGGVLILATPNIASLFRRLRLLLSM
jgi:2-polyprenyl-3-methyl-5-hydroxy-6-metoxy-1,4-benzoquinol methylase